MIPPPVVPPEVVLILSEPVGPTTGGGMIPTTFLVDCAKTFKFILRASQKRVEKINYKLKSYYKQSFSTGFCSPCGTGSNSKNIVSGQPNLFEIRLLANKEVVG